MSKSIYPIITRAEAREQGLKFYFTGKPCKHGHLSKKLTSTCNCVDCRGEYHKEYRKQHKNNDRSEYTTEGDLKCGYPIKSRSEAKRQGVLLYFTRKLCKYGHLCARYVCDGSCVECKKSDKRKLYQKEYQKSDEYRNYQNSDEYREYQNEYNKIRKSNDPLYKMTCDIRSRISGSMKRGRFKKSSKTAQILGCSFDEFKIHIENQFTEGMSWDNSGEWHYDHIYPVSKAIDEAHLIELNHYLNFQPLWAADNIRKSNKILT